MKTKFKILSIAALFFLISVTLVSSISAASSERIVANPDTQVVEGQAKYLSEYPEYAANMALHYAVSMPTFLSASTFMNFYYSQIQKNKGVSIPILKKIPLIGNIFFSNIRSAGGWSHSED